MIKRIKPYHLTALLLCCLMSCSSERQFYGTTTGAMVGGMFGSTIGGIMGGWRGSDAGTLVGMVVGGAVGNAVTASKEERPYHQKERAYSDERYSAPSNVSSYKLDAIEIENIRFIDENRNQRLNTKERAKLVFNIYNRGNNRVYNISPIITTDQKKRIILSPSAIVGSLAPGQGIRYTADIYVRSKLRTNEVVFRIELTDGTERVQRRVFGIPAGD